MLQQSVQGITDLINITGLINLDFADVQSVMKDKGIAHIGIGTGHGDDKAQDAMRMAISSPLLETTIDGASNVLINVSGDISLTEIDDATNMVREMADDSANIIFGANYDETAADTVTVTVIATGVADRSNLSPIFGKKAQTTAKPSYTAPTQTPSAEAAPTVAPKVTLKDAPERFTPSKDEGNIIIPTFLKRK